MTDPYTANMRSNFLIIALILAIAVLSFFLFKSCNAATDPNAPAYTIDSLRTAMRHDSALFAQQSRLQNEIILNRTYEADSLQKKYDTAKLIIVAKGKEILALNARTKASKTVTDTSAYSRNCDTLTNQIDSMAQDIWTAGRTIDSLLFVNDDLKAAQQKQIENYQNQQAKERQSYNLIMQSYAAQHAYDSLLIKRTKKQRAGFAIVGGAAGVILRSIIK